MKKSLIVFATTVTSAAIVISVHLAKFENPTEVQKQLSSTMNMIAIAGTTAIFELLDDDDDDS